MQVGANNLNTEKIFKVMLNHLNTNNKTSNNHDSLSFEQLKQLVKKEIPEIEFENIQKNLEKIKQLTKSIDKEVKLSVNKDINRIIISIVEKNTGRIISEFPCDELQKLALSLKKVIDSLNE